MLPLLEALASGEEMTMKRLTSALADRPVQQQRPSIGCNIKWKPGNEPDYFG